MFQERVNCKKGSVVDELEWNLIRVETGDSDTVSEDQFDGSSQTFDARYALGNGVVLHFAIFLEEWYIGSATEHSLLEHGRTF